MLVYRLDKHTENCLNIWAQRMVTIGTRLVGVQKLLVYPRVSILGPVPFGIFVNGLDDGTEHILCK